MAEPVAAQLVKRVDAEETVAQFGTPISNATPAAVLAA